MKATIDLNQINTLELIVKKFLNKIFEISIYQLITMTFLLLEFLRLISLVKQRGLKLFNICCGLE
jgi:hypothetical protein